MHLSDSNRALSPRNVDFEITKFDAEITRGEEGGQPLASLPEDTTYERLCSYWVPFIFSIHLATKEAMSPVSTHRWKARLFHLEASSEAKRNKYELTGIFSV